ncbi:MAG: DUF4129 domain-containing protein [Gemmatimonadales bacterium]|nr:MAG: DUF4129 domain-containing protein [Gemmatimonadales bacterium]
MRWAPLLIGVVGATLVVAVGAAGVDVLAPARDLSGGRAPVLRVVGAAVAGLGLVVLMMYRKRLRPTRNDPDPAGRALIWAAGLMGVLGLIALRIPSGSGLGGVSGGFVEMPRGGEAMAVEAVPDADGVPGDLQMDPGFDLGVLGEAEALPVWILLALLVILGLWLWRGGRTPGEDRPERRVREPGVSADEAKAGLETALETVRDPGGDSRDQVTAAYRRLLDVLKEVGLPRRPHEGPHEHLRRALVPLGLRPEPLHRLAELYVLAEFSDRPITDEHRAQAIEWLAVSLEEVRR